MTAALAEMTTSTKCPKDLGAGHILGTIYKTKFGRDHGTIKIWSRPKWDLKRGGGV